MKRKSLSDLVSERRQEEMMNNRDSFLGRKEFRPRCRVCKKDLKWRSKRDTCELHRNADSSITALDLE